MRREVGCVEESPQLSEIETSEVNGASRTTIVLPFRSRDGLPNTQFLIRNTHGPMPNHECQFLNPKLPNCSLPLPLPLPLPDGRLIVRTGYSDWGTYLKKAA